MTASVDIQTAKKVAVVDANRILMESPQLEFASMQLKNELRPSAMRLNKLKEDYDAEAGRLAKADEQGMAKIKIEQKRIELLAEAKEYETNLARRKSEIFKVTMKVVQGVVDEIAREAGYDLVFDAKAFATPDASRESVYDISEQVLERLKSLPRM
ncbi:OmpH family outer membrane protein [Myxococcus sp. CA056]|nr:OmpH family outer membrane protein [Myxococcus sp. CA056]NTX17734.1 OmpH family outer membrane protein [Myxococcus sp. CA056]